MFHLRFGLSDHLKTLRDFVFGSRRRVKKVRIFRAWFSHSGGCGEQQTSTSPVLPLFFAPQNKSFPKNKIVLGKVFFLTRLICFFDWLTCCIPCPIPTTPRLIPTSILLEGKFFEEDVFGFWAVLAPIFGTAGRSQKWDRRLHLLSFLYNSLKTVPKTGPSGGPVFGASFDVF